VKVMMNIGDKIKKIREEKEISLCKNYRYGEWRFWLVSK
jgi:hypothetical protein